MKVMMMMMAGEGEAGSVPNIFFSPRLHIWEQSKIGARIGGDFWGVLFRVVSGGV